MPEPPKIFKIGSRYRVKQSFMSGGTTFVAREVLVFDFDSYGIYDNCFAYTFHSQTDGKTKSWYVFNNMSADSWRQHFESLDD